MSAACVVRLLECGAPRAYKPGDSNNWRMELQRDGTAQYRPVNAEIPAYRPYANARTAKSGNPSALFGRTIGWLSGPVIWIIGTARIANHPLPTQIGQPGRVMESLYILVYLVVPLFMNATVSPPNVRISNRSLIRLPRTISNAS